MESSSKESRMILAFEVMKNNLYLIIRAAVKLYGVPRTILQTRCIGVQSRYDIPVNSMKLTLIEEIVFLETILDLDTRGFQARFADVAVIADHFRIDRHMLYVRTR
jgi:hypothetical protein